MLIISFGTNPSTNVGIEDEWFARVFHILEPFSSSPTILQRL